MTKNAKIIGTKANLDKAINRLIENKISNTAFANDNKKMLDTISEKDILNLAFCGYLHNIKVNEVMSEDFVCFNPKKRIEKIDVEISKCQFHKVSIIQDDIVVENVSRRDVIGIVL